VGDNYAYYAKNWRRVEQEKRNVFWNWAAFFLGIGWMAHRKMYSYSWVLIGLVLVEIICEFIFKLSPHVSNTVSIATGVAIGSQGNRLYLSHVEQRLRELVPNDESSETTRMQLAQAGGTSVGAGIGFLVILLVAAMSLGAILGMVGR